MKNKYFSIFICGALTLFLTGISKATLTDRGIDSLGNHLIYDSDLNITWYDMTSSFASWENQVIWADGLTVNFGGKIFSDWRLPTTIASGFITSSSSPSFYDGSADGGYNITRGELGYLFYIDLGNSGRYTTDGTLNPQPWTSNLSPFINLQINTYWSETLFIDSVNAFAFQFFDGKQGRGLTEANGIYQQFLAIAVRDGDVVNIPAPGSLLLVLIGIITGKGFSARRKKA